MLERLKCAFIVEFVDAFLSSDGRTLFIVMAYCDRGDLAGQIKAARERGEHIPEARVLDWFVQIALALQYLHSNHVMHRDMKPQNVFLVGEAERVKVGDFGVSKLLEK